MQFEFDDDQRLLQTTVHGIIAKECSAAFVRSVIDDGADPTPWWDTMVGLYWPAVAIEEQFGGLGMSWVELAILLEELGRAVDPSPFLATTTQFVPAIQHGGSAAQRERWLSAVAAGSVTGTLAFGADTVQARATDDGWVLDGTVEHVVDADRADEVAVVASVDAGVGVFVVDRASAAERLTVEMVPTFDYTAHIGRLTLAGVAITADRRLIEPNVAEHVALANEEATLGWAITTVGACQRILDLTVAYVKQRYQFGVPIGSFQAVKHKAVDMYVAIERARALSQFAALTIVEHDSRRTTSVSMAKAAAGECQELVFQHGVQLFGGMGFTWENDLQIAGRRAKLGAMMFGSTSEHRRRVAREVLAA